MKPRPQRPQDITTRSGDGSGTGARQESAGGERGEAIGGVPTQAARANIMTARDEARATRKPPRSVQDVIREMKTTIDRLERERDEARRVLDATERLLRDAATARDRWKREALAERVFMDIGRTGIIPRPNQTREYREARAANEGEK